MNNESDENITLGSFDIDDEQKVKFVSNVDVTLTDEQLVEMNSNFSTIPVDVAASHSFKSIDDYFSTTNVDLSKISKMFKTLKNFQKFDVSKSISIFGDGEPELKMSTKWIVIDENTVGQDGAITLDDKGNHYIPMTSSSEMNIRYYINNDKRIPEDKVFYDYFGCGEIFVNIPENRQITGVNSIFRSIMNVYFLKEGAQLRSVVPDAPDLPYASHAVSAYSPLADPDQKIYGWMFSLDECFSTKEISPKENDETVHPICKYYSYISDTDASEKVRIVSPDYVFANHIPDFPSCACTARTGKQNTVMACDMYVSRQTTCSFYSPSSTEIVNVKISPKNTSTNINLQMNHFVDVSGRNVFDIINVTDQTKINQLRIPREVEYEDALKSAENIFDEYVSCYTDHSVDQVPTTETSETQPKSFIQTLIEV
jgi:hypothetical protein